MTTTTLNALDFGAVPDGATDCTPAIQKALDQAAAGPRVVYLPGAAGRYRLGSPLWLNCDRVTLAGDGPPTRLACDYSSGGLLVGVKRKPLQGGTPADLPPGSYPDLTGVLDASVAGAFRKGLRTRADTAISFPSSPATFGPAVARLLGTPTALVLDLCVRPEDGWAQPESFPLCGCLDNDFDLGWIPAPWYACVSQGKPVLKVRAADGALLDWTIGVVPPEGYVRLSFQLDFANRVASAWVNGTAVSLDGPEPPVGGLSGDADLSLFKLGSLGTHAARTDEFMSARTLTFAGFSLAQKSKYSPSVPGRQQAMLDGRFARDVDRFLPNDAATVLTLPLSGDTGHAVPYLSRLGRGFGLFLSAANADPYNSVAQVTVRDLDLWATANSFSPLLSLGLVNGFRVENCRFSGGYRQLNGVPLGVSYPLTVRDCDFLYAADTAVHAYDWKGSVQDCTIRAYGRAAARAAGCSLNFRDVFCTDSQTATNAFRFIRLGNNGQNSLERVTVNFEGSWPSESYVYAEPEPYVPFTSLVLRDCDLGTPNPDGPVVLLRGTADAGRYKGALLALERLRLEGEARSPVVQFRGPQTPWTVTQGVSAG